MSSSAITPYYNLFLQILIHEKITEFTEIYQKFAGILYGGFVRFL